MLFIETPIFTRRVSEVLDDEDYRLLQSSLVNLPVRGRVIPGSGGLRKLRWAGSGRGKRGGTRLIYRWFPEDDRILMLFIFAKNERADLTAEQLRQIKRVVEMELK